MKYNCIIFDCDGILVDSEAISAKIFQEMASELGCNLDFETVLHQITGTSMKENLAFFRKYIEGGLPASFETEFRKRSYEAFKTELKPIEGIHDLLKMMKIPVGVASSGPVEKIRSNLSTTKLIHFFGENIFSSYEIGSWKPEPQIYLYAAAKMGFSPTECAVIEDSLPGIRAAKAGGFDVYALTREKNISEFTESGAIVFSQISNLVQLLGID
ncbi:MAG: HAD family hydrolase [Bacteroidia bacterium]|nr:HAD family hydrolase [Bacteroidia bacterium]